MSNDQQSSIDFLLKELEEIGVLNIKNCHWSDEVDIKKAIEQAKAMHKTEIEKVAEDWWNEGAGYMYDGQREYNSFEQYYNETYGGNNEQQ
jgi:hypothetical protein